MSATTLVNGNGTCLRGESCGDGCVECHRDVAISDITMESGTQPRTETPIQTVQEYATLMEEGKNFPPIALFDDGDRLFLGDGFIRINAARRVGRTMICACIRKGTARDALLYGIRMNTHHGKSLSSEERAAAVLRVLNDTEWGSWTDKRIAELCGVTASYVGGRRSYSSNPNAKSPYRITEDSEGNRQVIKVRGPSTKPKPVVPFKKPADPPTYGFPLEERSFKGIPVQQKSPATLRHQVIKSLRAKGEKIDEHVKCSVGYANIVTPTAVYHVISVLTVAAFKDAFSTAWMIREAMWLESGKSEPRRRAVIVGEMTDAVAPMVECIKGSGIEVVPKV